VDHPAQSTRRDRGDARSPADWAFSRSLESRGTLPPIDAEQGTRRALFSHAPQRRSPLPPAPRWPRSPAGAIGSPDEASRVERQKCRSDGEGLLYFAQVGAFAVGVF
jgi:hypothetical protein